MKYYLFSLIFLTTKITLSQNNTNLFIPNHFSVTLKDGFNKAKFTPTFGNDNLEERIGHIFQAQFTYTFNINSKFGVVAQTNVGAGAFTYDLKSKEGFAGTEGWSRFYRDQYNPFFKLSTGINYHRQLKPKLFLNLNIGGGISINGNSGVTTGSHNCSNIDCTQQNESFDINYTYSDNFIGYGFADLSFNYLLKNKNLIGISLSTEVFRKPTLTGSYVLYNSTSGGNITNNNNNIALGINYIFTHAKKYEFNQKVKNNGQLTKKETKQLYKKQKRFVDPKSTFISAGTGLFFGRNIVNDPGEVFLSNSFSSWTIFGNAEVGIKNQYYYEVGLEVSEYWNSIKFSPYGSSGSNAFIATKLNLGMSKRFVNKVTNRNYFNLHAGLGISFQPNKKAPVTNGGGTISSGTNVINFSEINSINHHLFPSLYLALEKDLHLTKNLYLSLKYKYDQGFVNVGSSEIKYYSNPNSTDFNVISSKINGTAHTYSIGFKYKILTAKNRIKNPFDD